MKLRSSLWCPELTWNQVEMGFQVGIKYSTPAPFPQVGIKQAYVPAVCNTHLAYKSCSDCLRARVRSIAYGPSVGPYFGCDPPYMVVPCEAFGYGCQFPRARSHLLHAISVLPEQLSTPPGGVSLSGKPHVRLPDHGLCRRRATEGTRYTSPKTKQTVIVVGDGEPVMQNPAGAATSDGAIDTLQIEEGLTSEQKKKDNKPSSIQRFSRRIDMMITVYPLSKIVLSPLKLLVLRPTAYLWGRIVALWCLSKTRKRSASRILLSVIAVCAGMPLVYLGTIVWAEPAGTPPLHL
ncbi:hypothetical protein PRIPAC_92719 [Pristionchus pacificus]|uniref:Uncharacterized protein n=1 Tax=Pristionchus pacificus TaxID=54126 RepID=A0A2A6CHZ3_PRIPA|nr:hypothetical protein PRIPAC_92719 [Pristionchus pacificus]|eukprot:PDM77845.1 hypothetical protein PRIPAC_34712 [Pristionchus pacificus]